MQQVVLIREMHATSHYRQSLELPREIGVRILTKKSLEIAQLELSGNAYRCCIADIYGALPKGA